MCDYRYEGFRLKASLSEALSEDLKISWVGKRGRCPVDPEGLENGWDLGEIELFFGSLGTLASIG